jgi:hypothetical protein
VPSEKLRRRWTWQWHEGVPKLLRRAITKRNLLVEVYTIEGIQTSTDTTPGAFINFGTTTIYKNSQINTLCENLSLGLIKPGARVLFSDFSNVGILNLRYTSELLGIPIKIYAWAHAGVHDPQDWLGRKLGGQKWAYTTEKAIYEACDRVYFATHFYANMFKTCLLTESDDISKIMVCSQPHEELKKDLTPYKGKPKKRRVVSPHRNSIEKQPAIFNDLARNMPDIEFIACQELDLSKEEYHIILAESLIVWSANLQETFGISCAIEGPFLDCIPLIPNRLSYVEIFEGYDDFFYPTEWTENWDAYTLHKDEIIAKIRYTIDHYDELLPQVEDYCVNRLLNYSEATDMVNDFLD